jgi:hypothetical protein
LKFESAKKKPFEEEIGTSGLKPRAQIVISGAVKTDDGMLEVNRINVGRDGNTPPM